MIRWAETDAGFRAYDSVKTELSVGASDWELAEGRFEIPRSVDELVSGVASELRFPPALAHAKSLTRDVSYELGSDIGPVRLPDDDYLVNVNGGIKTFVRFRGVATMRKTPDYDAFVLSFPERTPVTFGFRSRLRGPDRAFTVPGTPEGVATALSLFSTAHETTDPNRSYHALRGHPPLVRLGEEYAIPDDLRRDVPETGIHLELPASFEHLFVAAPFAYYLGADVTVSDRETPLLRAPSVGLEREFRPLPEFQHDAADLLRRSFQLDCLVRNAGPNSTDLAETPLLGEIGVDAARTYAQSPAGRLATYLDAPFETIADDLPEWHLSMYVDPTLEHVETLPSLLDNLALVYLPETSELAGKELMKRSLDDFYRGSGRRSPSSGSCGRSCGPGLTRSIDAVKPRLQHGRIHGWLADGTPIDVFKTTAAAYRNRLDYLERETTETRVTVVLNDEGMDEEHSAVAAIYDDRSRDLPIDVTVREHLTRAELAEVFETPTDVVHYIGHCEVDGLRCTDGNLSIADIEESNVQTFFLNACGSYEEGLELVRKGSVAGAVTFKKVFNKQAAKVGTAFARLLINGFSIERAMRLSRRRIMMGKDYAVVGDGTHVLTQCDNYLPSSATLETLGDDRFSLSIEMFSARKNGGYYQPYIADNDLSYLYGTESTFDLDRDALDSYLERAKMPVIYEGDLYWSQELVGKLGR